MRYKMQVQGAPVPKGRPKFTRSGHTYTPKKTKEYEAFVAGEWRRQVKTKIQGGVTAHIFFVVPIPQSWSKKKKRQAIGGEIMPTCRPDIDNFTKAVLDGLNGVAYEDDGQVVETHIYKLYGENPRTIIILEDCVGVGCWEELCRLMK